MSTELSASSGPAIDRESPWPGLATFTEDQAGLFHGRDAEIRDLTKRAERNPLTVLFGQSGLGKSSLLQAGVFPRLRAASFCPIYIRLDHAETAQAPSEQVRALAKIETTRVGAWTRPGVARPGESLWEFFHHRDDKLVSANGRTVVPVLVLDQFEELFTLGAGAGAERARAVAFMSELAELVENRPSEKLVARLEDSSAEMDAFDFSRTDYRVVITLREDYLPHLESLKTIMPALMENRMRLARMTGTQALEAVTKPGGALVTEDVAHAIVEFVAGARGGSVERLAELDVEPPLLSVICRELNERRRALGQNQITADLVSGNRREILTDFYERSVADLPTGMRAFVEDHLLTKSGFRDNLALENALEFPGVTQPLIDTLVSRRLLRIEDRLGVQRVELTHDVLAEVIRASRDTRQQRLAADQLRQRERITRRRMWLARTIAAGLLVGLAGVSWIAWRAIRAEGEQARLRAGAERLRADADTARDREAALRQEAEAQELAAKRTAYAADMNGVQHALAMDNLGRARALLYRHRPQPGEMDLRGWEWRYLWQFSQSDARSVLLTAGKDSVSSLTASADGKWVAARIGSEAVLVNRETREQIRLPAGSSRMGIAFSPTEMLLAIGTIGRDNDTGERRPQIVWWNANSRRVERQFSLPECAYFEFAFSGDGRSLAVLAFSGSTRQTEISVWRVADGARVAGWAAGETPNSTASSSLAVTPDFAFAAAISGNNQVKLHDLKTGQILWSKVVSGQIATAVAVSPDRTLVATGGGYTDPTIRLWELVTGRELGRLEGHRSHIGFLQFSRDGQRLISGSGDQTIRVWNLAERTAIRAFRGHDSEVWQLALLPDGKSLVSGSKDGSVLLWDLDTERAATARGSLPHKISGSTLPDHGESLVTVDPLGNVVRSSGRMFQESTRVLELGPIANAVFARQRPLLAVTTPEPKVQVWDWDRRVLLRELPPFRESERMEVQDFSGDGSRLLVRYLSSGQRSFREWEIATGRETWALENPSGSLTRAPRGAYAHDGKQPLVFTRGDTSLNVFRPENPTVPIELNVPQARQPRFSPDGRIFAFPDVFGSVRLFQGDTFKQLATLTGFMHGVHSVTFSPDGQRLVTGGTALEAITIWDIAGRERLLTLPAPEDQHVPTAFSPDGNVLVGQSGIGATFGTLHFWRAPSWAEIEKAEAAATTP